MTRDVARLPDLDSREDGLMIRMGFLHFILTSELSFPHLFTLTAIEKP